MADGPVSAVDVLIQRILVREGGIRDVGDGMGVTRFGQTPVWLSQFGLPAPTTPEQAAENYRLWLSKTALTLVIGPVADDLADIVLDIAVMSDFRKAIKALQQALHVAVDGGLGPTTVAALAAADRKRLARDVIAWDMEYQGRLVTLDPSRARYAAGWANRMADHVRRLV